jgi:hypothetical protein
MNKKTKYTHIIDLSARLIELTIDLDAIYLYSSKFFEVTLVFSFDEIEYDFEHFGGLVPISDVMRVIKR